MSYSSEVLADSPLGYWRLGDTSGLTMVDSSGNGRNGTYSSGSVILGQTGALVGDSNTAVDFNVGTSYASCAAAAWQNQTSAFTVEAWVKASGSGIYSIVDRDSNGANRPWQFRVNAGKLEFLRITNAAGTISVITVASAATNVTNNAWHHVAATYDGTTLRLYIDGAADGSAALTGGIQSTSAIPMAIGANSSGGLGANQRWPSKMDEVAYYSTALSAARVAAHYAAGSSLPATTVNGGRADETDTALAGTLVAGSIVAGGRADETDTVLTGSVVAGSVVAGGLAVETDSAFAGTSGEVFAGGLAVESDSAISGAVTVAAVVVGGRAVETDTALAGSVDATTTFIFGGRADEFDSIVAGIVFAPPGTEHSRTAGRVRLGLGVASFNPAVVEPPEFTVAAHAFVSVRAYESVTMSGTRPVVTSVTKTQARRALDRVLVGGKDVTYFRGVVTPPPSYGLVAPLLYGAATLDLPQVSATFEQPGAGDLAFCAKGKKVLVQRVDPDTLEVLATDYKGIVIAHNINGRHLQLQIGGEATGRAALIDKQPPLFFKRNDLGFWHWGGITDLGLKFEPRLGIDTGIVLRNSGGMDHLSYLQELSAKGTLHNGAQYTIMPDAHEDGGAYRTVVKDLDTIHATVYLDDAVTVPDLRDDLAEQPNRAFATGVTPEGMRVKFGAYPVLRNATPPPYPMNDESDFGVGTVDADTDTGDGVSVMIWRLVKAGYLSLEDKPGGYDSEVADAIKDLKQDALSGFNVIDGDMTVEAWAALFDASATGYSIAGTQILPAAQDARTRPWNRTSNGSVISRNPAYDPSVIKVDTTIDAGVGMRRKQIRGFARGELAPVDGADYVGTITLNSGAVVRGEHTPGDPVVEADVMDARELRPGMNLWAPLFAGGRVLHVAGVERRVDDQGVSTVVLDVDTQARDTMKVWEVIRRNRESRRNPARAWLNSYRSSALTKDSMVEFDEIGGVLDDRVDLAGGQWTVFPLVAGQEGSIRSLRMRTFPAVEYAVSVFGREITAARLNSLVGDPMASDAQERWMDVGVRQHLDDDHLLLYGVGGDTDELEPCGYFPGKKSAAFSEVTGRWEDDASFSYHAFGAPVLWVAVWAVEDTHLRPGRIMWPQLEAGS